MSDKSLVERVARAMVVAFGKDPDELRPATGYSDAQMIPRWWHEIEWAKRHIAANAALSEGDPKP